MIVLGINEAHNSSCAIAKNGFIVAAAQEERFTRTKNQFGIPYNAIDFCLQSSEIKPEEIDLIVFTGGIPQFITSASGGITNFNKSHIHKFLKIGKNIQASFDIFTMNIEYNFHFLRGIHNAALMAFYKLSQKIFFPITASILKKKFGFNVKKTTYLDHHTAHAITTLFASPFPLKKKKVLIITTDGGGDGISATISTYKNGLLKRIAATNQDNSLGCLYGSITDIMGMNPLEHEYKVMGLAPYAEEQGVKRIYEFLKKIIFFNKKTLTFKTIVSSDNLNRYLREHLPRYRFDHLAGSIQKITEELLCELVQLAIKKTGIHNLVIGGGVAQNVKANQKIAELPEVESLFVMPSAGDESNAVGAAYWGCQQLDPKIILHPLDNLYLGPEFSSEDVNTAINKAKLGSKFEVTKVKNPEITIAELLVKGKIVARFTGRMEFGARALGNRSILADPSLSDAVRIINHSIKSRDFWMPFAPTILDEDEDKYVLNQKETPAPFMTLAFNTKPQFRKEIQAAIHPFDYTSRPQILTQQANPRYYHLLKYFKKLTGRGAILNTSFNLHGEPIVCSPDDAISTLVRSGLKYLVLEDYLIEKND